jgi:hypothetical protein
MAEGNTGGCAIASIRRTLRSIVSSGFSGFYLPLIIVLWLLILRDGGMLINANNFAYRDHRVCELQSKSDGRDLPLFYKAFLTHSKLFVR